MVRTDFTTNSYLQHFPKALYLVETHFLIMGVELTPRLLFSVTTSAKRILNMVFLVPMLTLAMEADSTYHIEKTHVAQS